MMGFALQGYVTFELKLYRIEPAKAIGCSDIGPGATEVAPDTAALIDCLKQ